MINILEFDPVITVFPYALLYYALLPVSSGLALIASNRSTRANKAALQTVLVIIFVSQLVLLTVNLLAYQGFQPLKALFPLAHRILNLISLLWLIWALFRCRDQSFPNWLPVALTAAVLLTGVLFSLWWLPNATSEDFNHHWMDIILVGFTLGLILLSAIVYYARYRSWKVETWLILAIAAAGFILYLLLPSPGNMPAIVMLSQILYYPLLISLSSHQDRSDADLTEPKTEEDGQLRANIADAFLKVSLQSDKNQLLQALTHSLSLYLTADLLGLVHYEPKGSQATLENTYDLIREDHIQEISLSTNQMPVLFGKFDQGEIVISNQESELKAEKSYLMEASGYNQIGNLLLYPLSKPPDQPRWAFLGLSPYTNKVWGLKDIARLDRLRDNLSRVLEKAGRLEQDARQIGALQIELRQKEEEVNHLITSFDESQSQLQSLRNEILQTQAAWTEEVNLWINRQKELESELETLQQTIEENKESVAEVDLLKQQKLQLEETIVRNSEQTAQLKTAIDQASLLLQKLSDQNEDSSQVEESKG